MIINPQKSRIMRILLKRSKCIGISNCINIPEVDDYCYLGITITQSLSLDNHENKMRKIEQFLNRRIGILKPSMLMTKSRLMLFDSILRAKISYALAIIWTHNKKYIEKWESMLYRLIKRMFWIKMNIEKKKLFETLGIKNGYEYVKEIIEHRRRKIKGDTDIIEYLSIKAIKTRLNWLFQRKPKKPKWNWRCKIDEDHVINKCYKTTEWRTKWDTEARKICGLAIWDTIMIRKVNNIKEVAKLINNAIDDLVIEYLG